MFAQDNTSCFLLLSFLLRRTYLNGKENQKLIEDTDSEKEKGDFAAGDLHSFPARHLCIDTQHHDGDIQTSIRLFVFGLSAALDSIITSSIGRRCPN